MHICLCKGKSFLSNSIVSLRFVLGLVSTSIILIFIFARSCVGMCFIFIRPIGTVRLDPRLPWGKGRGMVHVVASGENHMRHRFTKHRTRVTIDVYAFRLLCFDVLVLDRRINLFHTKRGNHTDYHSFRCTNGLFIIIAMESNHH